MRIFTKEQRNQVVREDLTVSPGDVLRTKTSNRLFILAKYAGELYVVELKNGQAFRFEQSDMEQVYTPVTNYVIQEL